MKLYQFADYLKEVGFEKYYSTIRSWELGKTPTPAYYIKFLSDKFNANIEYLMLLVDSPKYIQFEPLVESKIDEIIELLKEDMKIHRIIFNHIHTTSPLQFRNCLLTYFSENLELFNESVKIIEIYKKFGTVP